MWAWAGEDNLGPARLGGSANVCFIYFIHIFSFSGKKSSSGKKKGAARRQELNRRGDEKMAAGSDMDIFVDTSSGQEEAAACLATAAFSEKPLEAAAVNAKSEQQPQAAEVKSEEKPLSHESEEVKKKKDEPKAVEAAATTADEELSKKPSSPEVPTTNHVSEVPKAEEAVETKEVVEKPEEIVSSAANVEGEKSRTSGDSDAKEAVLQDVKRDVTEEAVEATSKELEEEPPAPAENQQSPEPKKPKLKYTYKEDQWSPINVEGKKQYDRDFLMQLQKDPLSIKKPKNLPNMEIIKDKVNERPKVNTSFGKAGDWMPSYVKPTLSRVSLV